MPDPHAEARERPTAELVRELSEQMTLLLRKEIELAKAELSQKGRRAGLGAGMFGAAGLLGVFAFGALTACAILALATGMAAWLAALIVSAVYGVIAAVLALVGRREVGRAAPQVPTEALESTKEDLEWLKTRAKSARSS